MKAADAEKAGYLLRTLGDIDCGELDLKTPYVEVSAWDRKTAITEDGEHAGSIWMPADVYHRMIAALRVDVVERLTELGVDLDEPEGFGDG